MTGFKPGDRVHLWGHAHTPSTTGTVTGTTPEGSTIVRWDDNDATTPHHPQHLEPAGEPMSHDPRIEPAAKSLWDHGKHPRQGGSDWVYMAPEDERKQAFMSYATAALAAADNAATITTVEDLDALPVRSVILDECGESFQRLDMEGSAVWSSADLIASDLVELPARVIHWGTE